MLIKNVVVNLKLVWMILDIGRPILCFFEIDPYDYMYVGKKLHHVRKMTLINFPNYIQSLRICFI